MRKLVDMAKLPKDAASSWNPDDNFKLTYQGPRPGNATTEREGMKLVTQASKPGSSASNSVESVAPPQGKK